ncbi:MAG: ABC transporter substrate-binding protein, partial [Pseudomonadota bacterium]
LLAKESLADADLIGNGPFRYLAGKARSRLRLERIDDGQVLEFLLVKDPVVRALKLRKGEIHLAQNELGPELADYLKRRPEVAVQTFPGSNFTYLGFNLEDAATGDVRVRRAIAHAIDRDAIREFLFRERVDLAETLFPPRHWLGFRTQGIDYDPDLARALLGAAGYGPENPLELDYKTSSDPFRIRVATVIQDQLAKVGIRVKVKSYDWGTFYGDVKSGNFQMYSLTWVGLKTPDSFRYIFHGDSVPPAGANRGRYRSPRVDRLIERAEQEEDLERQQALYRELQEQLLEDLPYIPLWYEHHVVAMRPELTGYAVPPDGNYDGLVSVEWRR